MRQWPRGMLSGRLPYRLIRLKHWGCPMVASVQFLAHVSAVSMNNLLHWYILPLVAYKPYTQTESFALFLAHVSAALIKNLVHFTTCSLHKYTLAAHLLYLWKFYSISVFLSFLIDSLSQNSLFLEIKVGKVGQVCMLYCGVGAKMFMRLRLMQ